ncbi:LamG domain-containing protein [Candidatus Poribacteria bacterium]
MVWTQRIFLFSCLSIIALACGLLNTCSYADVPKDALMGAWLFDEGSGDTVADASGNGNDMTVAGGDPKWVDGKSGKAMEFDGAADYLAAPDSDSLDSIDGEAVSIVVWVNGTDFAGSARHILRKVHDVAQDSTYILRVQNNVLKLFLGTDSDEAQAIVNGYTADGATQLVTGEWVYLALVYDGKELIGYVNGEVDLTLPATGNIVTSDQEIRIGRGDPAGYFAGTIDELGLFKAALTEDQVKEIMDKGLAVALAVEPVGKLATAWGAMKR